MYCLAQPSVLSHIVLNDVVNNFFSLINEIKRSMCAVVVTAYYFLSSYKKEWNTAWRWRDGVVELISAFDNALKISNAITSIDTDIFPL